MVQLLELVEVTEQEPVYYRRHPEGFLNLLVVLGPVWEVGPVLEVDLALEVGLVWEVGLVYY